MRILFTGGTGVLGTGTVTELLGRGHEIVLLSRHANDDARQWPDGVTPRQGNVAEAGTIHGAAQGCDVVLHMVGVVEETPPEATFERVNVQGTANVLAEATRAGARRFVYVSSLGAPTGESAYHQSKRAAEKAVRGFEGSWTICRPGNVYGPGDEQFSMLLRMIRGPSPIIPKVGDGDQPIQPIWWDDAAQAIASIVERSDLDTRELDLAGAEVTSQNDLIERFSVITGQEVSTLPLPDFVASLGSKALKAIGWDAGFTDDQLTMLKEGNVIRSGDINGLTVLGITPTPLDVGLRALADQQPEQLPSRGIGALKRKRFWVDITGSTHTPESLFQLFAQRFDDVTPSLVDAQAEPGTTDDLVEGASLTLALPIRGHVQVRVSGLEERQVTLITLAGHPLAGAVRFLSEQRGQALRFQIEAYDRAANVLDLIAMRTVGDHLQDRTWMETVERMVELSGGTAAGVQHDGESLSDDEAERICTWLEELTLERKRAENEERIAAA